MILARIRAFEVRMDSHGRNKRLDIGPVIIQPVRQEESGN